MKSTPFKFMFFVPVACIIAVFFVSFHTNCSNSKNMNKPVVDLAIVNGKIWTADPQNPYVEAIAIAMDKIVAVGTTDEIKLLFNQQTKVIDAQKQLVVPGFTCSHVHFIEGGLRLNQVKLREAKTPKEFIKKLSEYTKTISKGDWILGGDWDHENWGGTLPDRTWIDEVTPNNPVFINRLDGHTALANSAALKLAGITAKTPEVDGGVIGRLSNNEPNGILKDNAMMLVYKVIPVFNDTINERAIISAMNFVAQQGVTSVHHMAETLNDFYLFDKLRQSNRLTTRISFAAPIAQWEATSQIIKEKGLGNEWLRLGAVKGFIDGSLGSKTAAFFEPYLNQPDNAGLFVIEEHEFTEMAIAADKAGLQLIVHAIGDRANNFQLNVVDSVIKANGQRDRRPRIEHTQHLAVNDIPRFKALGVIASMQPYHLIDDGRWAAKLIGERIKTTYCFRSLIDASAMLTFGSDWYVAPPTPLEGIYAAVTRATLDNKNPTGWVPEQKITVEEALRAYTINPAYASFEEKLKGSIEVGKLADIVIVDKDLFSIEPLAIRNAKVVITIVGGRVIYQTQ